MVPILPAASLAEKVTRVSPTGKTSGALWLIELIAPSTSSLAAAPARNAAMAGSDAGVPPGAAAATVRRAGGDNKGEVTST